MQYSPIIHASCNIIKIKKVELLLLKFKIIVLIQKTSYFLYSNLYIYIYIYTS